MRVFHGSSSQVMMDVNDSCKIRIVLPPAAVLDVMLVDGQIGRLVLVCGFLQRSPCGCLV